MNGKTWLVFGTVVVVVATVVLAVLVALVRVVGPGEEESFLPIVFNGLLAAFTGVLAYATWMLVTVNKQLLHATQAAAESATQSAKAATEHAAIAHRDYEHSRRPVAYVAWEVGLRIVKRPEGDVLTPRRDILWIRGRLVEAARVPATLHNADIRFEQRGETGENGNHVKT